MEIRPQDPIIGVLIIFIYLWAVYSTASIFKIGGPLGTPRYKSMWDFVLQVMNIRKRKY